SPDPRRPGSTDIPRIMRICWCATCSSSRRKNYGIGAAAPARASEFEENDREMTKIWMAAIVAGSLILAGCGGDKPAATAGTEASSPAASGPPGGPHETHGGLINR